MLLVLMALACQDYNLNGGTDAGGGDDTGETSDDTAGGEDVPAECKIKNWDPMEIGTSDLCPEALPPGFTPEIEWDLDVSGGCMSLPIVADLDGDGMPNVLTVVGGGVAGTAQLYNSTGEGDLVWNKDFEIGYGSVPAVADFDGDGDMEIVVVRQYQSSLFQEGDFTALLLDHNGTLLWESEHVTGQEFDYASAPSIADMDGDGEAEIVIGRVIINSTDGSFHGVGEHGHGSYGITSLGGFTISESSVSLVADLDLDGTAEVIVGNAAYNKDGSTIWHNADYSDGMVAVADLDSDPQGEIIAIEGATVRAMDSDGTTLWGPLTLPSANILSTPAIADVDLDGYPEIVVAGGNELWVINHDGTVLWTARVTDESGATGASIFDFEGDGQPEIAYIDELQMVVYDGMTGGIKFYNSDHGSPTMFDYPVVADVDADDHAEILVCHNTPGLDSVMSVYGDADATWADAREIWNQHAYSITNINDDGTVPTSPTPSWSDTNTWHAGMSLSSFADGVDLSVEILQVCEDECAVNKVFVTWRVLNYAEEPLAAGVDLTLYADDGISEMNIITVQTNAEIPAGWTGEAQVTEITRDDLMRAERLFLVVDDDGSGAGALAECSEDNNRVVELGPFCD